MTPGRLPYPLSPLGRLLALMAEFNTPMRRDPGIRKVLDYEFRIRTEKMRIVASARAAIEAQGDPLGTRLKGRSKEKYDRRKIRAGRPGVTAELYKIDDPYNRGKTEKVIKNIHVTTGDRMHARGQIDDAQKRAYDKYLGIYQRLCVPSGAIDPSRIRVDSSSAGDPFPGLLDAAREYELVSHELGHTDSLIMHMVVGQELSMSYAAVGLRYYFGEDIELEEIPQYQMRYIGKRFRDALTNLAHFWHFIGTADDRPRRTHPFHSGPPATVDESKWEKGRLKKPKKGS